jgi:hypothetical protein
MGKERPKENFWASKRKKCVEDKKQPRAKMDASGSWISDNNKKVKIEMVGPSTQNEQSKGTKNGTGRKSWRKMKEGQT